MAAPSLAAPIFGRAVPRGAVRDRSITARLAPLLVVALTALGLILRLRGLVVPWRDIWIDEAFSIWLAELPPWHAVQVIAQVDQHPPLYALLLHLWLLPRDDPWWARFSSVLAGTTTIPVAGLLGRAVRGWRLCLVAAALVAFSPILVRYSQEVRMYALVSLFVFLSTLLLVQALAGNRRGAWVAFGVVTLLLVYTHNITLFLLPAQALFVCWKARSDTARLRAYLVTMAVVGLLWLPWVPVLVHQARGVVQRFWISPPTWPTVAPVLLDYVNAFTPKAGAVAGHQFPLALWGNRLLWPFVALALLGLVAGLRRFGLLFLLTFALPILITLGLSHVRPIFEERVLLYVTTGAIMLLASGIAAVRMLPINLLLLAPILWLNILSLNNYNLNSKKEQWQSAANYVAQHAQPGDLILFNATWAQLPFDYYYRRQPAPALVKHGLPVDLFDRGVLEPPFQQSDITTAVRLSAGHQHVWLLLSHNWYNDPEDLIPPVMGTLFSHAQKQQFSGIQLVYYSK